MSKPYVPSNVAQGFAAALMRVPTDGSRAYAVDLDFTADTILTGDLQPEQAQGEVSFVQSIWIDNSQNASQFIITFLGAGAKGYRIVMQAFRQGWQPVCIPAGVVRYIATTSQGIVIPVIFSNVPVPYFTTGPNDGSLVVPALQNKVVNLRLSANGANILIPGVGGQQIKVYRLLLTEDADSDMTFKSNATALSGEMNVLAGGSILLPASGVQWFTCAVGEDFVLTTTAAVNIGGMIGYTQN